MITLRNNGKYLDVRVFTALENGEIDFSSSLALSPESARVAQINGFFEIIKEIFLAVFLKDDRIHVAAGELQAELDRVFVHYELKKENRFLEIEFPMNMNVELRYSLVDLVGDPMLLLGSHEEIEDYDYGCYVYNIKNSQERQELIRVNWK